MIVPRAVSPVIHQGSRAAVCGPSWRWAHLSQQNILVFHVVRVQVLRSLRCFLSNPSFVYWSLPSVPGLYMLFLLFSSQCNSLKSCTVFFPEVMALGTVPRGVDAAGPDCCRCRDHRRGPILPSVEVGGASEDRFCRGTLRRPCGTPKMFQKSPSDPDLHCWDDIEGRTQDGRQAPLAWDIWPRGSGVVPLFRFPWNCLTPDATGGASGSTMSGGG